MVAVIVQINLPTVFGAVTMLGPLDCSVMDKERIAHRRNSVNDG